MIDLNSRAAYTAPVITDLGSHSSFVKATILAGPPDGVTIPNGQLGCTFVNGCNGGVSPL